MNKKLFNDYKKLKKKGLSAEQDRLITRELNSDGSHDIPHDADTPDGHTEASDSLSRATKSMYGYNDQILLQASSGLRGGYTAYIRSLDELLDRDKRREEDGFPRKIRVGRIVKPGKGGKDKIIVVPSTVEEKFIHDNRFTDSEEGESSGGSGEGEEGDIIGEQPMHDPDQEGEGDGEGPGEGSSGQHEMESSAYDLGKILSEHFQLPNLKDKGKKRSLTRYTYDMTDRHRGFGQVLDKKATLHKIVETNIHLGNIPDVANIDPTGFIISPYDKVYRILSREKDYESQAMVFFLRDYSGSMGGPPTQLVVAQHVLVYSWLLYQYEKQVETRFILHDSDAKEVPDFYTYYNSKVAGGTKVASAYRLVNKIVQEESLEQDYNIYIFHGTDGDDWDTNGEETIPEVKKMMAYANRIGITVVERGHREASSSEVEKYLKKSEVLDKYPDLIRLDTINADADEPRLIDGIKKLISQ